MGERSSQRNVYYAQRGYPRCTEKRASTMTAGNADTDNASGRTILRRADAAPVAPHILMLRNVSQIMVGIANKLG